MFKHHTKSKGDLGVLKVKLDLFEQGFLILNPETEHAPFDLVAYQDGKFKRIQVKFRTLNSRGALEIPFRSSYCNTNGVVTKPIEKEHVDVFAVYCPETDQCYYFDPKKFCKSISLRVNMPRNNQGEGIHLVEDFRKVP
jgi:PD-(D/E)XK endonuclease